MSETKRIRRPAHRVSLPVRVMSLATVLTIVFLAGFCSYLWSSTRWIDTMQKEDLRTLEVLAEARHSASSLSNLAWVRVTTSDK
ncbi:MAG: hypothetical protein ACRD8O_05005, partial [Bryobacteraceae bacterium]